jgi:DnaJ-class molecular chaperone
VTAVRRTVARSFTNTKVVNCPSCEGKGVVPQDVYGNVSEQGYKCGYCGGGGLLYACVTCDTHLHNCTCGEEHTVEEKLNLSRNTPWSS